MVIVMSKNSKTLKQLLDEYGKIFYEEGDHFDAGCSQDKVDEIRKLAIEINPQKLACYVSGWCWWDLQASSAQKEEIEKEGKQTVVLNCAHVIHDERERFPEGHWVRTSMLTAFHPPALFETANTFYLMVGSGTRKTVSIDYAFGFI